MSKSCKMKSNDSEKSVASVRKLPRVSLIFFPIFQQALLDTVET